MIIKILSNFVFVLCICISFTSLPSYCMEKDKFELKHADTFEASEDKMTISGNLVIQYNDSLIEAPKGIIKNNTESQPSEAIFQGGVRLKDKDKTLDAKDITISLQSKAIYAYGNVVSKVKDKDGNLITISSDYQELHWDGTNSNAKGEVKTTYKDTTVKANEALFIYKEKKPEEAIFYGINDLASVSQPNNLTSAKSITFYLKNQNIHASGNVSTTIWPDDNKPNSEEDPVVLKTEELYIENEEGKVTAINHNDKVKLTYNETKGESTKVLLIREKSKKPDKIIFIGNAVVSQPDKELISEEVVFNFKDKKLTSNTKTNIRPKTVIYKNK